MDFFLNVVHGRGIISWAAVDRSRSDSQCDELIGFVTARVIAASEDDVSSRPVNNDTVKAYILRSNSQRITNMIVIFRTLNYL